MGQLRQRPLRALFNATPPLVARLCAAVVLIAPLSLLGTTNQETFKQLGLTRFAEPVFPEVVKFDGVAEGHVTIALSRNAAGKPADILVLEATHPGLAEAAVEAVRMWRFQPSNTPDDLKSRTLRIGFKLQGIVVFPFGKDPAQAAQSETGGFRLTEPVKVPQMQALAQAPKALTQPMPAYPATLRARAVDGTVAVRFYVDEDGRVRLPEVIEATTPEFADAALAAVSQWRYEPPQDGGRRIVASEHWQFQFKANN
jgi:TonB family protein